jgi:hypothetical protein
MGGGQGGGGELFGGVPRSFKPLWGIFGCEDCGRNFVAGVRVDNLSDRGCVVRSSGGSRKQMEATPAIRRVLVGEPYFFASPDDMKMFAQLSGSRTSFCWGR